MDEDLSVISIRSVSSAVGRTIIGNHPSSNRGLRRGSEPSQKTFDRWQNDLVSPDEGQRRPRFREVFHRSLLDGAWLLLRLPAAPLPGIFPLPYGLFRRASVSGIFISADRSRRLFLVLIIVLLLSVRPFLFRLLSRCGSVLQPSRFYSTVRCSFWAFARGVFRSPRVGFRGCLARRFGGMAGRASLSGGRGDLPFMGSGPELEGVGRRAVGSVYRDPLYRVF
jgi:hypothetical protein